MNKRFVTVLIDTYNHERFIKKAIVSVLEQDFPHTEMEILVVDDGSTDRTPEIVRQFAPRVRLLQKPNGGQASAFNAGIPEANGEIIAFLDGDDWWARQKLLRVAEAMDNNPAIGMVGHAFIQCQPDGDKPVIPGVFAPLQLDSVHSAEIFRLSRCYFGTSRLALRSIVARGVPPVPEALVFEADEYLFTVAAALTKFVVLKEPLTYYRVHPGNLYLSAGSSREGLRRKQRVLGALELSLRAALANLRIPADVAGRLLEIVSMEALQARLMSEGGSPSETWRAEHTLFQIQHADASVRQRTFHAAALLPAWVLPPTWYYRARSWLTAQPWYLSARKAYLPVPGFTKLNMTGTVLPRKVADKRVQRAITTARDATLTVGPTLGPILCLCQEDNHRKILPPYARAFRSLGVSFIPVDWFPPFDVSVDELLDHCSEKPSWIFHFESDFPLLPKGLENCDAPTVCFQIDTNTFPRRRLRWSSLFDHVAVFHPGFDALFRREGHPGAFLHPHAVQRDLFDGLKLPREFEVGWVGQTASAIYRTRRGWIPRLAAEFRMNDWNRTYSLPQVADIYRRSRVVVNFGRDDFPQDANMRVFEVLAAGALLVTSLPSELTALGFVEGVHFIGYKNERDILPLVRRFLNDEPSRARIADAGRAKVLAEHTYDVRAAELLRRLSEAGNRKLAPARRWPASKVRLAYLDFFAGQGLNDLARTEFRRIAGRGLRETVVGATLLGKAHVRRSLSRWRQIAGTA